MFFDVTGIDNNWTIEKDYEFFMEPSNNSNLTNNVEFIDINGTKGLLIQSKQNNAPTNFKYSITLIFAHENKKYRFQIISDDLKLLNSNFTTIKNILIIK